MSVAVPDYSGYQRLPSWVLGFHGCEKAVALKVLRDQKLHLRQSGNLHDWLGDGVYFWENDPKRALQFAQEGMSGKVTKGKIKNPFVIGAVIDLGLCFNLFDQTALEEMRTAAESFIDVNRGIAPIPENKGKRRFLDRAVFEHMHLIRDLVSLPEYQTVRAAFSEGDPLYPGTEITAQNHIQIAVRKPKEAIRGYFLPRL